MFGKQLDKIATTMTDMEKEKYVDEHRRDNAISIKFVRYTQIEVRAGEYFKTTQVQGDVRVLKESCYGHKHLSVSEKE
uniref:Uncharacterized protein n=1 Tax=Chromera velia CCMP2878 TaxID=1169474 RepID=A0A0G4F2W1_9ALVE|eukprot:Cvel_14803.t1-p1 / transcript=Cvel_14803.t1 / gene=Cvel_14803 / organism=Chromera_velia_CCMP2878 / gene_product=hypothetical protein / transcript_product=hypothetical protein / location=Cvel_scaffold1068:11945-12175(+) / protein_length=77 / sequence_SO=supercontig / SO=protein_coding / is_pseudo=false